MNVLIADDAEYIRNNLKTFFKSFAEVNVIEATNGLMAFEMFEKEKPSLIFLDIVMPDQSGIATAKKIRESNSKVPIIAMSTLDKGELIDKMMNAGANSLLKKPFTQERLKLVIKEQLGWENIQ